MKEIVTWSLCVKLPHLPNPWRSKEYPTAKLACERIPQIAEHYALRYLSVTVVRTVSYVKEGA